MRPTATILVGDALTMLRTLPDASVNMCWTSPPYWGLRDYGTAKWEGGSAECDHLAVKSSRADRADNGLSGGKASVDAGTVFKQTCGKCGARRIDAQQGLEPTPEAYVAGMVAVFREVRRVLRDDGTCWVNVGDSYVGPNNTANGGNENFGAQPGRVGVGTLPKAAWNQLPAKNLVGIPWRLAFALQADGWYLRQDIIWAKPNPMPESVTDRCTKAHEYIFMLAKNARYYYDQDALKEPADTAGGIGGFTPNAAIGAGVKPTGNMIPERGRAYVRPDTRNRRSVWTVATEPSSLPHFAMAPTALVRPCVLAGCPRGGTVLDPFAGAGTTGVVAMREGRNFIGIELSPKYAEFARARCARYWERDRRIQAPDRDQRQPELIASPSCLDATRLALPQDKS